MRDTTVLEFVRRRSAVADLFRLATARRVANPSTVNPAEEPDQVALAKLESYFWRAERREAAW